MKTKIIRVPLKMVGLFGTLVALSGCFGSDEDSSSSTPLDTWSQTAGTSFFESATDIEILSDGGFVLSGKCGSEKPGDDSACLVKLDEQGKVQPGWPRKYGETGQEYLFEVKQMRDGSLLAAGEVFNDSAYMIRTDLQGSLLPGWPKKYGFAGWTVGVANFIVLSDGGLLLVGRTDQRGAQGNNYDFYLQRIDVDGRVRETWPKVVGSTQAEYAKSACELENGGFAILGDRIQGSSPEDLYLTVTDAEGVVQPGWPKTYGGAEREVPSTVLCEKGGGFMILGSTRSLGSGEYDVYLIRTDREGTPLPGWPKTYGGPKDELANSLIPMLDGGYVLTGFTASSGAGKKDVYLLRVDSDGNPFPDWPKTYGGPEDDGGAVVRQTRDGGLIVAGTTASFGAGATDMYILKTDASGKLKKF